ncbi:hypothetical protein BWI96_02375 [Siphonobacter sp. SORGH_AS_0500]|uniref:hypothetical protein n=1 Tax=Siphonobacter sp. SORGH_AS_0500 TaxID=1864824 RepID=UPI000CB36B5D|nr:hypothetical protein [Siphonobacter sp. SORGH_AS_0500]PKK37954.1 hypothetical protein BWI96_02375 [Siphonobacter sp. SORGH_AS_0500]
MCQVILINGVTKSRSFFKKYADVTQNPINRLNYHHQPLEFDVGTRWHDLVRSGQIICSIPQAELDAQPRLYSQNAGD